MTDNEEADACVKPALQPAHRSTFFQPPGLLWSQAGDRRLIMCDWLTSNKQVLMTSARPFHSVSLWCKDIILNLPPWKDNTVPIFFWVTPWNYVHPTTQQCRLSLWKDLQSGTFNEHKSLQFGHLNLCVQTTALGRR